MPSASPAFLMRALAAVALLAASPAAAAGGDCSGYDNLKDNSAIAAGRVAEGAAKTYFVNGASEDKDCPGGIPACTRKAFLVPGDGVLVSGRSGAFACVTYANAKGTETSGWMPAAALAMDKPAGATTVQEWTGSWLRDEATVTLKPAPGNRLAVKGDATFGVHDPGRVKRGAVNIGEIGGTAAISGDRLAFTMGDEGKTLAIDKGDEFSCKVWMRRVGDYLLVDDNNNCGGMNVSFRGTYVRR